MFWFSFVGSLFFSPGSWCTQNFFVPSKTGVFVSPQSCESPVIKSHWPSGSDSRTFSPFVWSPVWPDIKWTFTTMGGLYYYSGLCHTPGGYVIWSYSWLCPPTISLWLLHLLDVAYLFLVGSSNLLSVVVLTAICDLVLSHEEMSTRPSTPPSWTRKSLMLVWFWLKETQEPGVWFKFWLFNFHSTYVTSCRLLNLWTSNSSSMRKIIKILILDDFTRA